MGEEPDAQPDAAERLQRPAQAGDLVQLSLPGKGPLFVRYSERHPAFPAAGETFFRVIEFHPTDSAPDPERVARLAESLPGLVEHMEPEDPGMHTTDSVDFGVVLEGEITLELDEGKQERLRGGDVFVQNGTRHAWRVDQTCRMAVVLTGIPRRTSWCRGR